MKPRNVGMHAIPSRLRASRRCPISSKAGIPALALVSACTLVFSLAPKSEAALTASYQFNGKGNWSIDAVGSNDTPVGFVSAIVPVGSTIEKAFYYSSLYVSNTSPTVNFDSTVLTGADFTNLGANPTFGATAYRADVTALVAAKIGGGSASPFTFDILSEDPNSLIDGGVLAIIYSNPLETTRTIAFLDGFSNTTGDTTEVNFTNPLTQAQLDAPTFEAQLSLGIGFSAGGENSQYSTINIDTAGNTLSSSAGGYDDGQLVNGALITAGGIGDNPANPADPNSTTSPDDELYTLDTFLSAGMTGFDILTLNPSANDNIFFAGLNITAVAGVNEEPPDDPEDPPVDPPDGTDQGVPDGGSTLPLLGLVFALGFGGKYGRRLLRL